MAKANGVSVGAHPGYRDLHGFGRRPVPGLKSSEIENLVAYQIGALQAIATAAGHKVTHVKAHGALSNVACEDDMTANAIARAIKAVTMAEAQTELRRYKDLMRSLPGRVTEIASNEFNTGALFTANVAGHAVSATDVTTWPGVKPNQSDRI